MSPPGPTIDHAAGHVVPRTAPHASPRAVVRRVVCGAGLALAACGRDKPVPARDSTLPIASDTALTPVDSQRPVDDRGWSGAAGPVVYVPGDPGIVQVVLPRVADDSVPAPTRAPLPDGAAPASVELFGPSGLVGRASIGGYSPAAQSAPAPGCDAWPELPLRRDDASSGAWRFALARGVATPLPLEAGGTLAMRDSSRMIADVIRAAATLGSDSAGTLARVPFAVLEARRALLADRTELVIAVLERRINAEADPRAERTTLILERAPGARAFTIAWKERQYVPEDELVSVDLLGAVTLPARDGAPLLFLGLDFGDGTRLETLERTRPGEWRIAWSSAYTGC
ncbi:MAG: hypothetical protein MUF21_07385 [Gemmatimonadaceae bacterium]|jgi:hypothetical protein|nr:hypothetical protein [Gemmatimonadaceae bacterium]